MFKKIVTLVSLAAVLQPCAAIAASQQKVSNDFAINLFREVSKGDKSNTIVSPYSISTALTMTNLGANGKTKAQMQEVLGYSGLTDKQVEEKNSTLSQSLSQVNPKSQLSIANALFGNKGVPLRKEFVAKNEALFKAKLTTMSFSNKKAIDEINNWVKSKTEGKIPTILDNIPEDAILYLINAIYFKGTWQFPFKESDTQKSDFYLSEGGAVPVQMMHKDARMNYLEGDNFQAVMLPYADERLNLCVILPAENENIDSFIAKLTPELWNEWMNKIYFKKGMLGLPKVKLDYKVELSKSLKQLGMPCAFDQGCADFSRMVDLSKMQGKNVLISRVLHKTFLEIDERGTTAAGATAVEMVARSAAMRPPTPFRMICNRPYIIALRDSQTGTILFLGKIVKPS